MSHTDWEIDGGTGQLRSKAEMDAERAQRAAILSRSGIDAESRDQAAAMAGAAPMTDAERQTISDQVAADMAADPISEYRVPMTGWRPTVRLPGNTHMIAGAGEIDGNGNGYGVAKLKASEADSLSLTAV